MPTDTLFRPLTDDDTLDAAFAHSEDEPVLLFKHSNRCDLSAGANEEMQRLTEASDPAVYRVVVQEARSVSDAIEARTGLRHETPQAILLYKRTPIFDASHRDVTARAARRATLARTA